MRNYQEVKLWGKDDDGFYLGQIEEIATGSEIKIGKFILQKERPDSLFIKNRKPFAWIFSIFTGYRQVGIFNVKRPHDFKEGDWVIAEKKDNKIIGVVKSK